MNPMFMVNVAMTMTTLNALNNNGNKKSIINNNKTMKIAILNEWHEMKPDQVIPEEVEFISVDTRDFHWMLSEEMPIEKVPDYPICWSTTDPKNIYFLINELRVRCKDKKWNFLQTKHGSYWDMKYIWFKREDDGRFSVWTRNWRKTLNTTHGLAALVDWEINED